MFDEPEVLGGHPIFHSGGSVDRSIIPMEKPPSGGHIQSLLLENQQEPAQGLHNVVRVECLALGHIVCIDEPLVVEKRKDHLFAPSGMDLGFDRSRLAFLVHCLDCTFISGV
jgi:hypothetical protein